MRRRDWAFFGLGVVATGLGVAVLLGARALRSSDMYRGRSVMSPDGKYEVQVLKEESQRAGGLVRLCVPAAETGAYLGWTAPGVIEIHNRDDAAGAFAWLGEAEVEWDNDSRAFHVRASDGMSRISVWIQ
jgi:hypothetical protein